MNDKIIISVTKKKILLQELNYIYAKNIGSVVSFVGLVRKYNNDCQVQYIYYDAFDSLVYSMVLNYVKGLLEDKLIEHVSFIQRKGFVSVGEVNLFISLGTCHRQNAFIYLEKLVKFTKTSVPVWKKEYYFDGSYEWLNV